MNRTRFRLPTWIAIAATLMAVLTLPAGVSAQTPALQVAAGGYHTCAVLVSGRVKCWGYNANGQLGYGDTLTRGDAPGQMGSSLPEVPLHAGVALVRQLALGLLHTCALDFLGGVRCWGANSEGQLGYGHASNLGDDPGEVHSGMPQLLNEVAKIAAGYYHSCALMQSGGVTCWGNNYYGQLGTGDTQSRRNGVNNTFAAPSLGTGRRTIDIALAGYSTCVLLDNNQVKCWGYNSVGTLGLGDTAHRGDAPGEMGDSLPVVSTGFAGPIRAIAAGAFHVCAIRSNNNYPKCWGYNISGQLGLGDTNTRGDGPGEMGTTLPHPGGTTASWKVTAGFGHTCVSSMCFGDNTYGQLGRGNTDHIGDNPGEMTGQPPFNLGLNPSGSGIYMAVDLAAGGYHTCALLNDGAIKCWGLNSMGQLGLGDTDNRGDAPGEMGAALPVVDL